MSVKSPISDDVFKKFITKTSAKKLQNLFGEKGIKFEKGNVSAAESVENVVKSAAFFFRSEVTSELSSKIVKEQETDQKGISKLKFFDFPKIVNPDNWKGKETVPMYNSIAQVNCKKCEGKGYMGCKNCGSTGLIKCNKCDGTGKVECKRCKGKGKLTLQIQVLVGKKKEKQKKIINYQCGDCFGSGKIVCKNCSGMGKILCNKCKPNFGKAICKDCNGTGKFYKYKIGTVPFHAVKGQYIPHLFFKPEFEKKLGTELSSLVTTVDGIYIKSLKDLDEEFVKAQLGYWDGEIKSRMNDAKKKFKELEKSKGQETPKFPIYLFPILKLNVKSKKGKTFNIYSIGTDRGYHMFAPKI
ncbi:MAG: hypothetical protein ACTSRG_24270 [Candidatus Helarchaeota archaeon]